MIQILLPVYNPDENLLVSIKSLVEQSNKSFSVIISDNFSKSGKNFIQESSCLLKGSGISVKIIKPPYALDRVGHWNWIHFQATDGWLKPLFAGDSLRNNYIQVINEKIKKFPNCKYIYVAYKYIKENYSDEVIPHWTDKFIDSAEMMDIVKRYAHQFGPPSASIYKKDAFVAVGGYNYNLPICADSLFFCTLAANYGGLGISKILLDFNIHDKRFSKDLVGKDKKIFYEKITYELMLNYYAYTRNYSVRYFDLLKLLLREFKLHYLNKIIS